MARSRKAPRAPKHNSALSTALQRLGLIADLETLFRRCNLDELRVLLAIARRIDLGRERYGFLDLSKERNWEREAAEEAADLVIYRAAAELGRG